MANRQSFDCGFRRSELVGLEWDEGRCGKGHSVVVDWIGKGGHAPFPYRAVGQGIVQGFCEVIMRTTANLGPSCRPGYGQNGQDPRA